MGSNVSPWGLFASESLVHTLNLHMPEDAIAVECGVYRAYNLVKILENCQKIKTIFAVDQYLPYTDYIEEPTNVVDKDKIARVKEAAYEEISQSKYKDKVVVLEKSSLDAARDFDDNSINFIFLDSYLSAQDVKDDLHAWYPKLAEGGIMAGHDWEPGNAVDIEVHWFCLQNNIKTVSFYDMVWVFIK